MGLDSGRGASGFGPESLISTHAAVFLAAHMLEFSAVSQPDGLQLSRPPSPSIDCLFAWPVVQIFIIYSGHSVGTAANPVLCRL